MAADPFKRADELFDILSKETKDTNTKLLLHALDHLCTVTVENGIGGEKQAEQITDRLNDILDKLDKVK